MAEYHNYIYRRVWIQIKRNITCIVVVALVTLVSISGFARAEAPYYEKINLWYASANGITNVSVSVSEGHNGLPEYALKSLLEKKGLIKGLWSEIPDGTRLIRLSIEDKIATVNFNNEFLQGLTNNHNVYLLVKSISNTLFQFDDINAMRILVEGKEPGIINDFDLNKVIINQPLEINISSEDAKRPDYIPDIPDPVIYLDAGHGGTEPGAVAQDGTKEKDINLAIALKVKRYLESQGATVIMSRTTDVTKGMNDRIRGANNSDADFIVSIHCNSATNTSARGTQSFYPSRHDVSVSKSIATSIHNQLLGVFPEFNRPTTHDGIGLLTSTNKPAILVETAFMSNSQDLSILKSQQDAIAYRIYLGIKNWWWR